jgi:hypothetical protein
MKVNYGTRSGDEHPSRLRRAIRRAVTVGAAMALATTGVFWNVGSAPTTALAGCMIYVASGDDIANGHDLSDDSKRYPEQLVNDHIKTPGWCLYNQAKNGQSSSKYISDGGLSSAYNMRPDLLTLQLGEQNDVVSSLLNDCFDNIKDHQFLQASACAAIIYGNAGLWDDLKKNFTTILQQTRIMQFSRPKLVVAVVNYPNPFPQALDVAGPFAAMCAQVVDTIATCMTRWSQLPAALTAIDQVVQKLNQTLKDAIAPFQAGPSGSRWVYVDVYPKFKNHCMKMTVSLFTTVFHPPAIVDTHNAIDQQIGCSQNWFTETYSGNRLPDYLPPAADGVLLAYTQTTRDMGKYPNTDGQKCIADAIWDADTIQPGTTPLKWLLGYGEESKDPCN